MTFPKFINEASCAGSATPDDWFPEFSPTGDPRGRVGIRDRYSYTPEAMRARNTCLDCSNWFESKDICGFYKMKPPANIIVRPEGQCEEFTIDVPF